MTTYDRVPTNDEDTLSPYQTPTLSSSSLSPSLHRSNGIFPDLTNAIRARASSFVSDLSGSMFRTKNSNSTSAMNDNSNLNMDTPLLQLQAHDPSSSSSSSTSPLFLNTPPLQRSNSTQSNDSDSRRRRIISNHSAHVRLLRMIWLVALLVGEHGVYWAMINRCSWPENSSWDNSEEALKERYRVAIVADPQLTDWMSYNQTGLLLGLVETYTDIFMKRSFHRMHASLRPDAVLFLGDLNDGGRASFGEVFEKNKYRFFEKVFETKSTAWNQKPIIMDAGSNTTPEEGSSYESTSITGHYRQLVEIPSDAAEREAIRKSGKSVRLYVAGNHDVGFGDTLVKPAMIRYKQEFGSVNYEVNVGNHSFVVLDTLALSSKVPGIREEAQHFLEEVSNEPIEFPRILFTHVPLFRLNTTYCGDARESDQLIINEGGDQYQNMISSILSREILRGIKPDIVFSGDDHDWCEIAHSLDGTLTPEVTLRTFSFSQGISQPGFVMLSLYNPDHKTRNVSPMAPVSLMQPLYTSDGYNSAAGSSDSTTFVYEECMMPNQMLIYRCYIALLGFTVSLVLIQRFRWIMWGRRHLAERSVLVRWRDSMSASPCSDALPRGSTTASALSTQPEDNAFVGEDPELRSDGAYPNSFEDEVGQLKKTVWPLLSTIYWKMVAWDVWNIVRYVVPFYLILFVISII
ncbi:hypothetical protein BGX21_008101 [Mortierella sp. AD011]|nr:hypothetical protein BGX21_008101 [Mortierella sp. AD011]